MWRPWLLWLWRWAFLLGLGGVAGYVGGHLAAKPPGTFDWTAAAIAATAAGTVVLAIVTWGLAYDTRRDVEATLNDQRTRDRPTVIVGTLRVDPTGFGEQAGEAETKVSVSLYNMGLGPAIGVEVRLRYEEAAVRHAPDPGKLSFIQSGGDGTFEFEVTVTGATEVLTADRFVVEGDYYDRRGQAGERYENAIIDGYRSDNAPPPAPPQPLVSW